MREASVQGGFLAGSRENVYGTYVHGIFDRGEAAAALAGALAARKGIRLAEGKVESYQELKEKQYDKLADTLSEYLQMEEIYGMLRESKL